MEIPNVKKILIIDNDLVIRYTLKKIFSNYLTSNLKIYTSSDGLQGLGYVYVVRPDLIIIDTTLPKYSGRELTEYIKTNQTLNETPVILLNEGKEKFENLPKNYIQVSKEDLDFPNNLINETVKILNNSLNLALDENNSRVAFNSTQYKLINFLSKKILRYSNISDVESQKVLSSNILLKGLYYLKYLFDQFLTSVYLTFFYILVGKKDYEETVDQKQKDLERFRVKTFPAIAFTLALIFFGIIQFLMLSGVFVALTYVATAPAYAASYAWDGGGSDGTCGGQAGDGNKWSCALNWSSDIVPTAGDSVVFDSTSTKNSTIDASFAGTVNAITITTGYSGTLTVARSLNITTLYSQSTGTFNGANQTITNAGTFTLSGGTFTSTSGTMIVGNNFTVSGAPTFNANSGTVEFNSTGGTLSCNNITFSLVKLTGTSGFKIINSNCSLPVGNNPTLGFDLVLDGAISGTGTITLSHTTTVSSTASITGFTAMTIFNLFVTSGTWDFSSYTSFTTTGSIVSVAGGSLTLPNGADINGQLVISAGTFNAPSGTMTIATNLTISGSPTFNHNSGTISFDTSGTGTLSCNNVTFNLISFASSGGNKTVNSNCSLPLGNNPTISSNLTLNGTITGTGTINYVSGQFAINAGAAITGFTGFNGTGNAVNMNGGTWDASSFSPFILNSSMIVGSGSITVPNNTDINGQLIISGGTFNAASGSIFVSGNLTISGSPTFNANGGILNMDGSTGGTMSCNNVTFATVALTMVTTKTINSNCTLPLGNNPIIGPVSVSGALTGTGILTTNSIITMNAGGTVSGFGSWVANGGITLAGATLNVGTMTNVDVNGAFIFSSGVFTAPSATMTISRALTISGGTFNANGGTITFDGASTTDVLSCNNVTFNLVAITHSGGSKTVNSNCTLPLGNNPVENTSIILNGTLSGTGTLALVNTGGSGLTLNAGATVTGFSGISSNNSAFVTVAGATANFSALTSFTTAGLITLSSGTLTLPSGTDLNGALTISGGTFNAPSGNMTLAGALTISGTPIFNHNSGTITFDGSSATLACNNVTFNLVVIGGGRKTVNTDCNLPLGNNPTINSTITVNGTLSGTGTLTQNAADITVSNAAANLSGFTGLSMPLGSLNYTLANINFGSYTTFSIQGLSLSSGTFTAPTGTMSVEGITISGGSFVANSGTLNFIGGAIQTYSCNNATFNRVTFNLTGGALRTINSNCSFPLGSNPNIQGGGGTLTLNGTLSGSNLLTLTSAGLTLNSGSSLIGFGGLSTTGAFTNAGATTNLSSYTTLTMGSTTTVSSGALTLPNGSDLNGNLVVSGGTLTAPNGTMTLAGNATLSGSGVFTHNNGTVILDGTNQTLTGTMTFNNLTKNVTSASTLTFNSGVTKTITGILTLKGTSGNLLSLRSNVPGSHYYLDAANVDIQYLDVKDSNNTGSSVIQAAGKNITNSGNNIRWNFDNPSISSIAPQFLTNGSNISNNKPSYSFNITDPQTSDTVKFQIQIDNTSDFTSPEVDYTSALQSQGGSGFTVGQAVGGGIYITGSENQTLSDAAYYVRIKGIDASGGDGGYSTINNTSSAFTVDTIKPTGSVIYAYKTDSTSRDIYLIMSVNDNVSGVDKMMISENSNFTNASFEEYRTSKLYTVSDGYGQKTIYVKFRDRAGNESVSYIVNPSYTQAAVIPTTTPNPTQVPVSYGTSSGTGTLTDGLSVIALRVISGNNSPLSNVSINIPELGITTTTDENGLIVLENVPLGNYSILGLFDNKSFNRDVDINGDKSVITIRLEDSPNNLTIILAITVVVLLFATILGAIYIYLTRKSKERHKMVNGKLTL